MATDRKNIIAFFEGTGKQSQKKTYETFKKHIASGANLIHDKEAAHKKLVQELALKSTEYSSKELKGLPDNENPMNPVNRVHAILKLFLNAHSGFDREYIQGYLNLFAIVSNPPHDLLEKVDLIINLGFSNPKLLRYRGFFSSDTENLV